MWSYKIIENNAYNFSCKKKIGSILCPNSHQHIIKILSVLVMSMSKEILWEKCLSKIKLEIPAESYATWFVPTSPHSLSEETLCILIPNNFYKECLQQNYHELIKSSINELVSNPLNIDYKVAPGKPEPIAAFLNNNTHDQKITSSEPTFNSINPRYTFFQLRSGF